MKSRGRHPPFARALDCSRCRSPPSRNCRTPPSATARSSSSPRARSCVGYFRVHGGKSGCRKDDGGRKRGVESPRTTQQLLECSGAGRRARCPQSGRLRTGTFVRLKKASIKDPQVAFLTLGRRQGRTARPRLRPTAVSIRVSFSRTPRDVSSNRFRHHISREFQKTR